MRKIENVDYRQNEWTVMFVDTYGERQATPFDLYEDAEHYAKRLRERGTPLIGIVTSYFFNAEVAAE